MLEIGITGYGTIGKRTADAIRSQPDMAVAGVAKTRPNFEARIAVERDYPLYAAVPERADQFDEADIPIAGSLPDLVESADVIVDATPSGIGAENRELYDSLETPAIYQGGESASVADVSFNARSNYAEAIGADHVRVVSCNTTGLSRVIAPLEETVGIEKVRATLVRRGGDPAQTGRGPINDILPNPVTIPSHHGPDVNTIFPALDIDTLGMKVPATLMHVHSLNLTLEEAVSPETIRSTLADERRLYLFGGELDIDGAGKLKELAQDADRPRGDLWENCIWADSIATEGRDCYLFQAIHQEADVVPENVDAIRAITDVAEATDSMATTDETLGVGSLP